MSEIKNGEGNPVQGIPNFASIVEPKIWPSQYPSLICTQCQERSLIQPVLPSAPYPITPVLEHIPYPRLPMPRAIPGYHYLHEPNRIYNVEEPNALSNSMRPTISAVYKYPGVTPVTEESGAVQTTVVLSETEDTKENWTTKYCSRICWMVGAFVILTVIGAVVFYQFFIQYRRTKWQIDQELIYGRTLRD